jgi:hypothetical protein
MAEFDGGAARGVRHKTDSSALWDCNSGAKRALISIGVNDYKSADYKIIERGKMIGYCFW